MSKNQSEETLRQVFSNAILSNGVIKNSKPLMEDHVPPKGFLHRNEQIRLIAEAVSPLLAGRQPSNLSIYGKTGTGKTTVTKWVLSRLADTAKEKTALSLQICYVNCRIQGSTYRIIFELCRQLDIGNVPHTGLAIGAIFDKFREGLDSQKKIVIVVFDEIDDYIEEAERTQHGNDLLYNLNRIQFSHSKIVIIGIANRASSKELLDSGTLSTLKTEEVYFPPYDAMQLKDILQQRAEEAFSKEALPNEGAINLCAALAGAEHGDARRALNLLRVASELAIRRGESSITERHIQDAVNIIEFDSVIQILKGLPSHMAALVISLFTLGETNVNERTTGRIYERYSKLCKQMNIVAVTQRRVGQLLNEMETMGITHAVTLNRGRYGRTKKITLRIAPKIIVTAFEDHPVYSDIVKSHLPFYI